MGIYKILHEISKFNIIKEDEDAVGSGEEIEDVQFEEPDENEEEDDEEGFSSEDFKNIIAYVIEIIKKEDPKEKELRGNSDLGLDLLMNYSDLLPRKVMELMIDDLRKIFDIEIDKI